MDSIHQCVAILSYLKAMVTAMLELLIKLQMEEFIILTEIIQPMEMETMHVSITPIGHFRMLVLPAL